jgi:hypothetical protein
LCSQPQDEIEDEVTEKVKAQINQEQLAKAWSGEQFTTVGRTRGGARDGVSLDKLNAVSLAPSHRVLFPDVSFSALTLPIIIATHEKCRHGFAS